ncbi:c-type cytochrome [Chitinophaga defluvii]|uniref:C-type cytochrome n=1 Tax=Chitinophaga defluvii TaxID=3163343 RepID=A0ABV2TAB7_9BACT
MRKRLLAPFVLSALFFAACGGSSNSNSGDQQANTSAGSQEGGAVDSSMIKPSANAEPRGKQLMAQLDCKTCHKEDVKLIGPSFKEIAAKYPDNAENETKLAEKIIHGGSGNWGEIAMLPHPDVKVEDAKEMVKYILSVK